jgi:uncharacterized phage protein gp47/JayE
MTSNYVDSTGLILQTLTDIVTELETGFKTIYGTDINVDANSPDGQMINLFAQSKIDLLECIRDVYNSFSPTNAAGRVLDQRCALNGVTRIGATKTTASVVIIASQVVALPGLDGTATPFTVTDPAGNDFYLKTGFTTTIGTNTAAIFEAANAGAIEVTNDTIKVIKTITYGITSVTNTGAALIQGIDEETDAALRFRRAISVANASSGYIDGLLAALLAVENVMYAKVYENFTHVTGVSGITGLAGLPPHSVWCITDGGYPTAIADVIYNKRSIGCNMYNGTGSTGPTGPAKTVNITGVNGIVIPIKFSEAVYQNLYVDLVVDTFDPSHSVDTANIAQSIYDNIEYDIYQPADYSAISAYVKALDPYAVITSGGVGGATSPTGPYAYPTTMDGRWVLDIARITVTAV